jgi:hypothetical protein
VKTKLGGYLDDHITWIVKQQRSENALSNKVVKEHGYEEYIRPVGAETLDKNEKKKYPARRRVWKEPSAGAQSAVA